MLIFLPAPRRRGPPPHPGYVTLKSSQSQLSERQLAAVEEELEDIAAGVELDLEAEAVQRSV